MGVRRVTPDLRSKPLLTLDEAAILLAISRAAIYRSAKRGDLPLPVITINGRMRIPRRAIERLLAGDVSSSPTPEGYTPPAAAAAGAPCPRCGRSGPADEPDSTRPTWSAARRSSAGTESV
jgi:excisionase family DNA binding protein